MSAAMSAACDTCARPLPYGGYVATPLCDACLNKSPHDHELDSAAAYARERRTCHAWEIRRARRSIALTRERIAYDDIPSATVGREAIARRAAGYELLIAAGRRHDAAVRRLAVAHDARDRFGFRARWDLVPGHSDGALIARRVLVTEARS